MPQSTFNECFSSHAGESIQAYTSSSEMDEQQLVASFKRFCRALYDCMHLDFIQVKRFIKLQLLNYIIRILRIPINYLSVNLFL